MTWFSDAIQRADFSQIRRREILSFYINATAWHTFLCHYSHCNLLFLFFKSLLCLTRCLLRLPLSHLAFVFVCILLKLCLDKLEVGRFCLTFLQSFDTIFFVSALWHQHLAEVSLAGNGHCSFAAAARVLLFEGQNRANGQVHRVILLAFEVLLLQVLKQPVAPLELAHVEHGDLVHKFLLILFGGRGNLLLLILHLLRPLLLTRSTTSL